MAKKYEIPEEEPQMVSEAEVAYAIQYNYEHNMCVAAQENDAEWEDVVISNPKLIISNDKLRRMGRECINASCVSGEDTIRHFMSM